MVPCEGTFYHSLRHARTDSRNDLKHTKDPTDRFQSSFRFVLLDLIRLSFGSPGSPYWTLGMPGTSKNRDAWCKLEKKTPSLTAKTEPRGSEKWSLERFGTAKMPSLRCRKKPGGAEVYRSTCAFHHQNPNFFSVMTMIWQWIARCHVESKHEVAVVSLTCFAAFPDCQFCSHWLKACQMREKPPVGFKKSNCFQFQ